MLKIRRDETVGACAVLTPEGEIDAFTVTPFRRALNDMAGQARLIIDLSNVAFIDSAGLGALIGGIRRAREMGGQVAVSCGRPALTRLLRSTGFDTIVNVAGSRLEAAKSMECTATPSLEFLSAKA